MKENQTLAQKLAGDAAYFKYMAAENLERAEYLEKRVKDLEKEEKVNECISTETDFVPCLKHVGGAWAGCRLAYCPDCGQNLYRECERENI